MEVMISKQQFTLSGHNPDKILTNLLGDRKFLELMEKAAEGVYFTRYSHGDRPYDESLLQNLAKAYLKNPDDLDWIMDEMGFVSRPDDDYNRDYTEEKLLDFMSPVIDALAEEFEVEMDLDEIEELVKEKMMDQFCEYVELSDESRPEDAFSHADRIELSFIPGYDQLSIEDLIVTEGFGPCMSWDNIQANANLARTFKFFNVSPVDYADFIKAKYDYDICEPHPQSDSEYQIASAKKFANKWKILLSVSKGEGIPAELVEGFNSYEMTDIFEMEKIMRTGIDVSRPPVIDIEQVVEVFDNATYGGVPVFVGRYHMSELLNGKLQEPYIASGKGFVGIHDFINGSGHIVTPQNPVFINSERGGLITRSVNDVYGIIESYMDCSIKPARNPDWVKISEDTWLSELYDNNQSVKVIEKKDGTFDVVLLNCNAEPAAIETCQTLQDAFMSGLTLREQEVDIDDTISYFKP